MKLNEKKCIQPQGALQEINKGTKPLYVHLSIAHESQETISNWHHNKSQIHSTGVYKKKIYEQIPEGVKMHFTADLLSETKVNTIQNLLSQYTNTIT